MADDFDVDTVINKILETRKQPDPDAKLTEAEVIGVCRAAAN
jgi:hypothetical protein